MSIPKILHLCWFGHGKYPPLAEMCINSWKKYLPDYEIRVCNEDSFDVNANSFTKKAYSESKWAFVSDYARLAVLYEYGGIYMDTDLEVIKDFTPLLENKNFVSSYIEGGLITAGYIACESHNPYIKRLLEFYQEQSNLIDEGKNIAFVMNPLIFTKIACDCYGFSVRDTSYDNGQLTIYPYDYFMPYKKIAFGLKSKRWHYHITDNTCTIHHDMSSWKNRTYYNKLRKSVVRLLLPEITYNKMKIKKNEERLGIKII